MGLAVIERNLGEGLYEVRQVIDQAAALARIAALQARAASVAAGIPGADADLAVALQEEGAATQALVALLQAVPPTPKDQVQAAQKALTEATRKALEARGKREALTLELAALNRQIAHLQQNLPPQTAPTERAWCADYSVSLPLGSEVKTVDRGRVRGLEPLVLYPMHKDAPQNLPFRGKLRATMSHLPEVAYYNYAMLPGLDKWRPRFRTGTVTRVQQSGLLDVSLDPLRLTHQRLETNQAGNLYDVPATYMGETDGYPFEAGDDVLVAFDAQDWGKPTVIGFAHDPKSGLITIDYSDEVLVNGTIIKVKGAKLPIDWTPWSWQMGAPGTPGATGDRWYLSPIDDTTAQLVAPLGLPPEVHQRALGPKVFHNPWIVDARGKAPAYYTVKGVVTNAYWPLVGYGTPTEYWFLPWNSGGIWDSAFNPNAACVQSWPAVPGRFKDWVQALAPNCYVSPPVPDDWTNDPNNAGIWAWSFYETSYPYSEKYRLLCSVWTAPPPGGQQIPDYVVQWRLWFYPIDYSKTQIMGQLVGDLRNDVAAGKSIADMPYPEPVGPFGP